jgi:hypothetical protein
MRHLIVYEPARSGLVDIAKGVYGNLNVVTGSPILTAYGSSLSASDLSFAVPNGANGVFTFDPGALGSDLYRSGSWRRPRAAQLL